MAALRGLDPEEWERTEAQGEWRAFTGAPDASDDEYWDFMPLPFPPETQEVEF